MEVRVTYLSSFSISICRWHFHYTATLMEPKKHKRYILCLQEKVLQRQREYYQCNRGEILRKQSERDKTKQAKDPLSMPQQPQSQSQGPSVPVPLQPGLQFPLPSSCPTMVPIQRTAMTDFEFRDKIESGGGAVVNGVMAVPSQQSGHANCAPHSLVKL